MSTTWFSVRYAGACVGWAAYHNTSDLWRPGIISVGERAAGLQAFGIERICSEPLHPLRWVDLISWDERPQRMLACLECHALEPQPWNEEDWYSDHTPETLARVVP